MLLFLFLGIVILFLYSYTEGFGENETTNILDNIISPTFINTITNPEYCKTMITLLKTSGKTYNERLTPMLNIKESVFYKTFLDENSPFFTEGYVYWKQAMVELDLTNTLLIETILKDLITFLTRIKNDLALSLANKKITIPSFNFTTQNNVK